MRARFTLVEMMIVVAIVMVLVAIAIPLVSEFQGRAKEAEVGPNITGIIAAEVAYHAANDRFVVPIAGAGGNPWGKSALAFPSGGGFQTLGWKPDGNVRGRYSVVSTGAALPATTPGIPCPTLSSGNVCAVGEIWPFTIPEYQSCPNYARWADLRTKLSPFQGYPGC